MPAAQGAISPSVKRYALASNNIGGDDAERNLHLFERPGGRKSVKVVFEALIRRHAHP